MEPDRSFNRRRTDREERRPGPGTYRAIAEEAYRLFVAGGRDRAQALTCWDLAELHVNVEAALLLRSPSAIDD